MENEDYLWILGKLRQPRVDVHSVEYKGLVWDLNMIHNLVISLLNRKLEEVDDMALLNILQQLGGIISNSATKPIFRAELPLVEKSFSTSFAPPSLDLHPVLSGNTIESVISPRIVTQANEISLHNNTRRQFENTLLQQFWDLAFTLFLNVSSSTCQHQIALNVIHDILVLANNRDRSASPAILVALDVVVQRAMYELSDKIARPSGNSEGMSDGMQNIEDCVSVMSHLALPLCQNEQNAVGLSFLSDMNSPVSIGCRMNTLNRQLQELLAWTSLKGQSRVSEVFPLSSQLSSVPALVDQTLHAVIQESMVVLDEEMVQHVHNAISQVITQHLGTNVTLTPCGACAHDSINQNVFFSEDSSYSIDFTATTSETASTLQRDNSTLITNYKEIETIVDTEVISETALKHLKACIKDFNSLIQEILRHISNRAPDLARKMEKDTEIITLAGQETIDHFTNQKATRQTHFPILMSLIARYEQLQELLEKDEKERVSFYRKVAKTLERSFRDQHGVTDVKCENSRARFVNIKMIMHSPYAQYQQRQQVYPVMIILESQLPTRATRYLQDYIHLDTSGKIRLYFNCIKKFIKSHAICDTTKGFLSTFAWQVMALHLLLHFEYLPNIHSNTIDSTAHTDALEKLQQTSVIELLDKFFRYYVEEFDLFNLVITLRNQGETLSKLSWQKNPVLWRVSIEDPFEPTVIRNAVDLGCTLSRPGQLTTFKSLRRAVYGIASIVAAGADSCHANIRKLFSKADLIHLARKSEYMGAIVNPPKEFIPNSSDRNRILSPAILTVIPDHEEADRVLKASAEFAMTAKTIMPPSPRMPDGSSSFGGGASSALRGGAVPFSPGRGGYTDANSNLNMMKGNSGNARSMSGNFQGAAYNNYPQHHQQQRNMYSSGSGWNDPSSNNNNTMMRSSGFGRQAFQSSPDLVQLGGGLRNSNTDALSYSLHGTSSTGYGVGGGYQQAPLSHYQQQQQHHNGSSNSRVPALNLGLMSSSSNAAWVQPQSSYSQQQYNNWSVPVDSGPYYLDNSLHNSMHGSFHGSMHGSMHGGPYNGGSNFSGQNSARSAGYSPFVTARSNVSEHGDFAGGGCSLQSIGTGLEGLSLSAPNSARRSSSILGIDPQQQHYQQQQPQYNAFGQTQPQVRNARASSYDTPAVSFSDQISTSNDLFGGLGGYQQQHQQNRNLQSGPWMAPPAINSLSLQQQSQSSLTEPFANQHQLGNALPPGLNNANHGLDTYGMPLRRRQGSQNSIDPLDVSVHSQPNTARSGSSDGILLEAQLQQQQLQSGTQQGLSSQHWQPF